MTTQIPQPRDAGHLVVTRLVDAGLLDAARTDEAERVVAGALATTATGTADDRAPLRRRMSEIAGYVGGAFVVGAAVLFFANSWDDLTRGGQAGILAVIAVLLAAAVGVLVVTGGGVAAMRTDAQAVRRRLASVLSVGAALAAGFMVGLLSQSPATYRDDSRGVLVGAGVALLVVVAGYVLAPSVAGQAAAAAAAFTMVPSGLDTGGDVDVVAMGLVVLGIGVVWLVLAETGVWREDLSARVIGSGLALLGAQIPVFDDPQWVGYVLTAGVAAAAFAGYVVRPSWPYLAAGVVGATLAVPEALTDWAEGSLGSAGVLLATGVTLLVAALLGLRLRHEVTEGQPHHP